MTNIFANTFLYIVFSITGYAALSKTPILSNLKIYFIIIMLTGYFLSIIFSQLTSRTKRTIYFLWSFLFENISIIFGSLCLTIVALNKLTNLDNNTIIISLFILMTMYSIYFISTHARQVWKRNVKFKKYDLEMGLFDFNRIVKPLKSKEPYSQFVEMGLVLCIFVITSLRYSNINVNLKYFIFGIAAIILLFFFLRMCMIAIIYPMFNIIIWERKNKKYFKLT